MKLVLYVHDLYKEIGHSRAMLETLNHFPPNSIKELKIICFTHDSKENLFSPNIDNISFTKVPFPKIKPMLLKAIFFHIYTLFYSLIFIDHSYQKISIGIASLCCDVINVQFLHKQWSQFYFQKSKMSFVQWLYKKILFLYLNLVESFLFSNENIKLICLSKFISDFCQSHYKVSAKRIATAYSSVNINNFKYDPRKGSNETLKELTSHHSELTQLDSNKPIALFVGAYERKGLPAALQALNEEDQIIVVGQPDGFKKLVIPSHLKVVTINHTQYIKEFYQLCDAFIFPTQYEPFGLVILEASLMGLDIHVTQENVGAAELLEDLNSVFMYPTQKDISHVHLRKLTSQQKQQSIEERKKILEKYSWNKTAKTFLDVLKTARA